MLREKTRKQFDLNFTSPSPPKKRRRKSLTPLYMLLLNCSVTGDISF